VSETVRLQAAGRVGVVDVRGTAALFPAGLVPDGSEVEEVARRRTFVPLSASVGALKELPWGMVAGLNLHYAERASDALELFAKGPHHASGTFEIGNPNLRKESAMSIEASLRRARGAFRFDLTAFHTRYRGFIYKRLTGAFCSADFADCHHHHHHHDDDHGAGHRAHGSGNGHGHGQDTHAFRQVAFDQRDANFTGVELAAQLDLLPFAGGMFGVDGQYDFVHARFADGSYVPRIPPHRLGGGVFWRDSAWFARVGILHAFTQTEIVPEETPTAGYNLLKAELSYTRNFKPTEGLRAFTVGIVGTNLLDEDVRNHVSFKKDEVLLPGRNVRLFATLRW
jgi:iron complex outermembrane recepter protein